MRISLGDMSVIKVNVKAAEPETRIRFAVTFAGDKREPLLTVVGFTYSPDRTIRPPSTRIRFGGRPFQFVTLSPALEQKLRDALERVPDVLDTLGPPPLRKPQEQAPRLAVGDITVADEPDA
jgi:uncharacterized protein YndB with AHSA1/START domain